MRIFTLIAGIICLVAVLFDAFQTIILPRRATGRFRITRMFYIATWLPWRFFAKRIRHLRRRETAFSYYGPLSLIFLLMFWAAGMVLGFALVFYALGSPFNDPAQGPGFRSDLYVSGTTIFTLGLGDVTPHGGWERELIILEAGTGLGFLAVVMGYFPVLYAAFSRREVSISLLDARAGSPPTAAELLHRHSYEGGDSALSLLPFATHQSELDQRPDGGAGYIGAADCRRARARSTPGPVDLCHGAPCSSRLIADLLTNSNQRRSEPAPPRAI